MSLLGIIILIIVSVVICMTVYDMDNIIKKPPIWKINQTKIKED